MRVEAVDTVPHHLEEEGMGEGLTTVGAGMEGEAEDTTEAHQEEDMDPADEEGEDSPEEEEVVVASMEEEGAEVEALTEEEAVVVEEDSEVDAAAEVDLGVVAVEEDLVVVPTASNLKIRYMSPDFRATSQKTTSPTSSAPSE